MKKKRSRVTHGGQWQRDQEVWVVDLVWWLGGLRVGGFNGV
jgi:hypothetical protein